jgi:hypothetical protein
MARQQKESAERNKDANSVAADRGEGHSRKKLRVQDSTELSSDDELAMGFEMT